jgi:hypothetical protein
MSWQLKLRTQQQQQHLQPWTPQGLALHLLRPQLLLLLAVMKQGQQ